MRKIIVHTTAKKSTELFEKHLKFDDESSALAICTHDDFVVLATSDEDLLKAFETSFKTEKASDIDLMNLQLNQEIKEIRGKEYTLMPFT